MPGDGFSWPLYRCSVCADGQGTGCERSLQYLNGLIPKCGRLCGQKRECGSFLNSLFLSFVSLRWRTYYTSICVAPCEAIECAPLTAPLHQQQQQQ